MLTDQEVALIPADSTPVTGRVLYWVLSRKQIEFILSETQAIPARGGGAATVAYQEEALPVLDLEEYFGLVKSGQETEDKYVISRVVSPENTQVKVAVRCTQTVRMRPLTFTTSLAMRNGIEQNKDHILGSFLDDEDGLYVVPDLTSVLADYQE